MPTDKEKKAPQMSVIRGIADDITLMPSAFVDASAMPIVGGLLTRQYVEFAEEMLVEDKTIVENQNQHVNKK